MTFFGYFTIYLSLLLYISGFHATLHWSMSKISNNYSCQLMKKNVECQFNDTVYQYRGCNESMTNFTMALHAITRKRCDISDPCRKKGTNDINNNEKYDFIIVGAGVAGPVIARRLVDREPWWRILLVEAGPEEPTLTAFPGFAFKAINTSLDWNYKTEPTQPNPTACLETNGVCDWPRGKMVSGTGGMYGMMYVRGHPEIYNRWARAGNIGWSYNEIEHYFERAENPVIPGLTSPESFKSIKSGGPVNIEYFPHKPPFVNDMLMAAEELGYKTSKLYGTNHTGFMVAPMMTKNGQRGTTSKFYLRPIAHKPNLKVLINARVTKLLANRWDKKIQGIELIDKYGVKKKIRVDKEVILTAGAIGSPHILLSSGIGPKYDLERLGISLYHSLPVGRNLHNHVSVGIKMTINDTKYNTITSQDINKYLTNQSGPLSSTGLTQVTAFFESIHAVSGIPDIQVFFDGFDISCPKKNNNNKKYKEESPSLCLSEREIIARPTVVIVKSRGFLTLRSNNPLDPPLIYPNYFTHNDDIKILLEGINKTIQLTTTQAMKKWNLKLKSTPLRACSKYHFATDKYWECIIRTQTGPENHQPGTCKMGPANDLEAVVDSQLRLHGIRNVRIADASIFPIVPNSNPCAAIIMIAEKAADLITNTWRGI